LDNNESIDPTKLRKTKARRDPRLTGTAGTGTLLSCDHRHKCLRGLQVSVPKGLRKNERGPDPVRSHAETHGGILNEGGGQVLGKKVG